MQPPASRDQGPPAPPATPPPSGVAGQGAPTPSVPAPASVQEMRLLRSRQAELGQQLRAADGRRASLARQAMVSTGGSRTGLEQQLNALDQQIIAIQSDLGAVNRQIAQWPVALPGGTLAPPPAGEQIADIGAAIAAAGFVLVLLPLAFAFARRIWKRSSPPELPEGWPEAAQRLERMEQAVDAIALEVERVTESQRFLTRILTERAAPLAHSAVPEGAEPGVRALGPGELPFEPVRVQPREAIPVARPIDQRP